MYLFGNVTTLANIDIPKQTNIASSNVNEDLTPRCAFGLGVNDCCLYCGTFIGTVSVQFGTRVLHSQCAALTFTNRKVIWNLGDMSE